VTWRPPLAASLLLALVACVASPPPLPETATRAERIRALPVSSLDATLEAFGKVCDATAPGFADAEKRAAKLRGARSFMFEVSRQGTVFCAVTARTSDPEGVWRSLRLWYGEPRHVGGSLFVFDRKGKRQMIYSVACEAKSCAERGTYQLALLPGRKY